jgi:hypothetical protein
LDLAAAAQTDNSHSSAVEILNFKSDAGLDLAERYLMAVSLATHPSEFLLQGKKKKIVQNLIDFQLLTSGD